MRVLWFSVTPSLYGENTILHNGGGWIASLEKLIRKEPDIKLGIVFEHTDTCPSSEKEGVTYYPINPFPSKILRLKRNFIFNTEENEIIPACLKIIEEFNPDIIHVFGSEWCFGLIALHTKVPVVIHIQGSIPPYYNAFYPPGYSLFDFFFYHKFRLKKLLSTIKSDIFFSKRAEREIKILKNCHYFMGRTEWDKNLINLFSPHSKYFYCSEALREDFFKDISWNPHNRKNVIIVSTISAPLYKGADSILKTARLLKEITHYNFEWRIFGIKNLNYHEWKTKIKADNVNIKLYGTISSEQISKELLNADLFVHPSYIDNSPNSICEAQILGLPIISTNVGGISSLVRHNETGLLSPANDPYTIASFIQLIIEDKKMGLRLGKNAREVALQRHDPQKIAKDLLHIYNEIVSHEKKY
jgi:glycosyltransferase involved in cell wall biosynthesis